MENENTYFIKINGKTNIPERLEVDKNYHITCDCSITQEQKDSNENGTYNVTFKAQPITLEILKDNGKIIKAKDPRKNSQRFRNYLYKLWMEDGCIYPFDEVYEQVTYNAMGVLPSLLRDVIKRMDEK
jgi:hypothetical protein